MQLKKLLYITKNKKLITFIIGLFFGLYFILNIYVIPHYGINWDEPSHYQRGQVYLQYFLTGEGDKINTTASRKSIYKTFDFIDMDKIGDINFSYWSQNDHGHPPLNGILASSFNRVFYEKLQLLGDIEAYHLFIVLASVALSILVFIWLYQAYGLLAGIIGFLSIALFPLFFGESHFNIKDPVQAAFYSFALYSFYKGISSNSWKWVIISSVFAGFALGTKFNILFIVLTITPWFLIYKWKEIISFQLRLDKKIIIACVLFPFLTLGIFYTFWPFLWQNPIGNLVKTFSFYKEIYVTGYGISNQTDFFIFGKLNAFAIQWIFYTTPIVILVLFAFGIFYSITKGFKEKNKTSLLILFWFLVPVSRVSLPQATIYGGVRQIMEFIPAMAILSGIGASFLVKQVSSIMYQVLRVKNKNKKKLISYSLCSLLILSFLPITIKLIQIHPNENVYFNPLIGGLKGAKEKNIIYWGNSFGNVYRQGIEWANQNLEKNSKIVTGVSYEESIPSIWFRKDIKYSNEYQSGFSKKGEYIIELTHYMGWDYFYYFNYAKNILKPVYEVKVDDVAILTIWKNDWENTKDEFKKKEQSVNVTKIKKDRNSILIDLEKDLFLTQITIEFNQNNCHFSKEGYFTTANSSLEWIKHPGDLAEIAFYKNFDPRKYKDRLSYLVPGLKTRFVKVLFAENNTCFKEIKKIDIEKI